MMQIGLMLHPLLITSWMQVGHFARERKTMTKTTCGVLAVLACGASVAVADVVVPNAYAAVQASTSGLNTFIRDSGNPRTGQLLINASQLTGVVGQQIAGITWRLWSGGTVAYPAANATWADYTINVGPGVAFGSQTTTFATNFAAAPTTVRSGPLTISAGAFPTGGTPRAFGVPVMFGSPYLYTGGNLCIEIRHTGSSIVNATTDFLEVALTTDPLYNTQIWSATATGNAATTGAQANFTVSNLITVPAPSTLAVLGVLALGRRRR
jgi:hypothetical protein